MIRLQSWQHWLLLLAWCCSGPALPWSQLWGQANAAASGGALQAESGGEFSAESSPINEEELERLAAEAAANRQLGSDVRDTTPRSAGELNFLQLLLDGGPLMIPLVLISVLVLSISLERLINLRMACVLPRRLRRELMTVCQQSAPVEPPEVYRLSLRYPSATARVLQSMLRKVGRPVPELESSLQDACQREADRMYATVRWLAAAAAIAPLLGLLGTVWGMILAFFETTQPSLGLNRTQHLAQGISIAFVNTLGGLGIAIPAAAFAHFFEGRIIKLMGSVQELLQSLIPRLEYLEGSVRFDVTGSDLVRRPPSVPLETAGTTDASGSNNQLDFKTTQSQLSDQWDSARTAAVYPASVSSPTIRGG